MRSDRGAAVFWAALAAALLASRLAHRNILWADEDYHLAAAIQILHGKFLYRDLWYDKPPLAALAALVFGGWPGWPLRIAGSLVALASCAMAFRFARPLWGRREAFIAAGLLAFFQIFYLPGAVLPFEPDTLLILPHLAAVYLAWRGRALTAGVVAGFAFLLTPKAAFVVVACALFGRWLRLAAGFAIPSLAAVAWLVAGGAFIAYFDQVWRWGWLYATAPGTGPQARNAFMAVLNWAGFHAALVLGAWWWWRADSRRDWRLWAWLALAFASAALGGRWTPRYFDAVLTALVIPAARGIALFESRRWAAVIVAVAVAVPALRFGPRYFVLAWEDLRGTPHPWRDVSMDQESRRAAEWLLDNARGGETIFVWGYRPNVVVYSRLPAASLWWDSQAITGVPADRHLADSQSIAPEWAARNQTALARSRPTFVIDGLSAYNPDLDIRKFPALAEWLAEYCPSLRESGITIYRRCGKESPR
jgi:hypothetical protein